MSSKKKYSSAAATATAITASPRPPIQTQKKPTGVTRKAKVICGVCQGPVVDGKDEALLCEGKCGYWLHRGCASVSPTLYEELSTSADPFVCLSCTNIELRQEIKLLRSELDNMNAVRQQLSALEAEVASLRNDVNTSRNSKQPSPSVRVRPNNANAKRSYARALTTTVRPAVRPANSNQAATLSTFAASTSTQQEQRADSNGRKRDGPRVKVDGVRKIWGTVPTCSSRAVSTTISKLVNAELQLQVRRKTRLRTNNKTVWWFVIRGTENELMLLEQEWDKVQNQTLWTLEYCYIPSNNTQPENSAPSQTQVSQIQNSAELTTATVPSAPAGDDGVASTPEPTESTGEHAPTSQPTDSNVNHSSPFRSSQELLPTT